MSKRIKSVYPDLNAWVLVLSHFEFELKSKYLRNVTIYVSAGNTLTNFRILFNSMSGKLARKGCAGERMIPDEWLRQLQVMMNATRWSTVLMLMLQVMVKTWEWQFVNTMEATMKQVERMQRRNAELKLDLTGKLEELRMVEIELGKKTENLQVLKRGEFLWTNESDYFAGIVG